MEMYITLLVHFVKKCAKNRDTLAYVVNHIFFFLNLILLLSVAYTCSFFILFIEFHIAHKHITSFTETAETI
jgi:hypothetical protein